ncbi:peptidoglycan-binding protein [Demequina sp. SO4-18]|uniref:peptidoglycan-binding protein n=1 Tax=Demequina sp. SO4-18 TaxID=3401026 RepID=UPI003B5A39FB
MASLNLASGGGRGGLLATAVAVDPGADPAPQETSTDVVTWLAQPASTVESGGELYRVNDDPVVLLESGVTIYRDLTVGDEGADVQAVEAALAALGFDADGGMTVDDEYTSTTATAVEDFQSSVRAEVTGDIDPTKVVTNDGPIIVTEIFTSVGDTLSRSDEVMIVSDIERVVEFSIDPSQRSSLAVGSTLTVTMPDRSSAEASVMSIDAALQEDGTYGVVALIPEVEVTGDKWAVTVTSSADVATDALLLDPEAILVTDTLGAAVRVRRGDEVSLEPITILGTASQRTAVEASGLEDGDELLY